MYLTLLDVSVDQARKERAMMSVRGKGTLRVCEEKKGGRVRRFERKLCRDHNNGRVDRSLSRMRIILIG
eukprot:695114-Prorocentrum_minimum.AAC.1